MLEISNLKKNDFVTVYQKGTEIFEVYQVGRVFKKLDKIEWRLVASLNKLGTKSSSKQWVRESIPELQNGLKSEHVIEYTTLEDWKNEFEYVVTDLKAFSIFVKNAALEEGKFYQTRTLDLDMNLEDQGLHSCLVKLINVKPDLENDLVHYELELHSTVNSEILSTNSIGLGSLGDSFEVFQPYLIDPDTGNCETILRDVTPSKIINIAKLGSISQELMDNFSLKREDIISMLKIKSSEFSTGLIFGLVGTVVASKFLSSIQKNLLNPEKFQVQLKEAV